MLFEDLYDSVLRRYHLPPAKVEKERQVDGGPHYPLLDAARLGREGQTKKVQEENAKRKNPSE